MFASLLNHVGCVGCVGAWVEWVKFLCGLCGLRGSKYFLRESTFYVGHSFYLGCVGRKFLRRSFLLLLLLFAWLSFYLLDEIILLYYNQ